MACPVKVEPDAVSVPAAGGSVRLQLTNTSAVVRYAFKCKSTNNDHYRVNPVYGFLEANANCQVEVLRLSGPPKSDDRLEILFMAVEPDINDPRTPFDGATAQHQVDIAMAAAE